MQPASVILIVLGALAILLQDIRQRLVSIYSIAVFSAGVFLYSFNVHHFFQLFCLNAVFFAVLLLLLNGYFILKYGRRAGSLEKFIGLGDIILLFVLCAAYDTYNYICFIILCCLFAILLFAVSSLLHKKKYTTIPFAAVIAPVHASLMIISGLFSYDLAEQSIYTLVNT